MTFAALQKSRRLLALVSALAVLMSLMAIYATPAQAHNGTVAWDCDGWTIDLDNYVAGAEITVTVDGVVVDTESDWTSYDNSGNWSDTQSHTLHVFVDADDDDDQPPHTRGSNGSFTPDWRNGEWSFTLTANQEACNQPPQDVTTVVAAGSCAVVQGQAEGSIDVTIDPASGATVDILDGGTVVDSLTSSGSITGLDPGTYQWEATAQSGYQLTGQSSGTVTIVDCEVTVSVTVNACTVDQENQPVGSADITIDPDSGATVDIYSDAAMNNIVASDESSGTVDLAPGTYYWEADGAPGFDIEGASSGEFTIEPCDVDLTVAGTCEVVDNDAVGTIEITVSVPGSLTVEIPGVGTFTDSDTATVAAGATYPWSATPDAGFAISGDSSGEVVIEDCTPPTDVGASIVPTVAGECLVVDGQGQGVINVVIPVDGGATVVISDADGVVETFTSDGSINVTAGATYTWEATPNEGFEFPPGFTASGTINIEDCTPTPPPPPPSPDEVLASILVTVDGTCEDGDGFVGINLSVDGGATVVVTDSDGDVMGRLSSDGTIRVPEGASYNWVATPSEGFEFPAGFASSGTITIERCSDPETLPFTGMDLDVAAAFAAAFLGAGITVLVSQWRREEQ